METMTVVAAQPAAPSSPDVDWEAAIREPAFVALSRSRRRFVVPAAAGAFAWVALWLVLVGFDPGLMGKQPTAGMSWTLIGGASQFVVVWAIAWAYMRRSRLVWEPMRAAAIAAFEARYGAAR
jgi:uncharacterized membrane protein (DUF485 family)